MYQLSPSNATLSATASPFYRRLTRLFQRHVLVAKYGHTSRVGRKVVTGLERQVTPPGNETPCKVTVGDDEHVGVVDLFRARRGPLGLYASAEIAIEFHLLNQAVHSLVTA